MLHWKAWELGLKACTIVDQNQFREQVLLVLRQITQVAGQKKIFLNQKLITKNVCHVNKWKGKKWIVLMKNKVKSRASPLLILINLLDILGHMIFGKGNNKFTGCQRGPTG